MFLFLLEKLRKRQKSAQNLRHQTRHTIQTKNIITVMNTIFANMDIAYTDSNSSPIDINDIINNDEPTVTDVIQDDTSNNHYISNTEFDETSFRSKTAQQQILDLVDSRTEPSGSSFSSNIITLDGDDKELQSTTEEENQQQQQQQINNNANDLKTGARKYKNKIIPGVLLIAIIIFVIVDYTTNNYIKQGLMVTMTWVKHNPYTGILVYTLLCFISTVLFIPGLVITLGGAYIFSCAFSYGIGIAIASFSVFVGASLGAIVSFLIGRYLVRNCIAKWIVKYPTLEAIDSALSTNGFRIMFLLRLSPIIPFNVLNYFAGVTAMTFMDNTLSLIGIIPGTILFVYLGASAGKITETSQDMNNNTSANMDNTFTIICVTIGIIFAIFGIAATSFYAKRELNKVLQRRVIDQEEDSENVNRRNSIMQN